MCTTGSNNMTIGTYTCTGSMSFLRSGVDVHIQAYQNGTTKMVHVYLVHTYNVMSQLSEWKRAHMCTEKYSTNGTRVPYRGMVATGSYQYP